MRYTRETLRRKREERKKNAKEKKKRKECGLDELEYKNRNTKCD
jgi:hypothetical protein